MINVFIDSITTVASKALWILRGVAMSEEVFKINYGEYKIMRCAFSRRKRNVETASVKDFISLSKNAKNFCCTRGTAKRTKISLYCGAGTASGENLVVIGIPIVEEEKKILDSLVTKSF